MARFERSKGSSRGDRGRSRSRGDFDDGPRFSDRRSGGRGSRGGGRRERPEMHEVVCDKCGKECEVPFKPNSDKPVYCSDCFEKSDSPRRGSGPSSKGLDEINTKLDKIMKALKIE